MTILNWIVNSREHLLVAAEGIIEMRRGTIREVKKFQVDERRRSVTQFELMIAELERMEADLQREIFLEEKRARIHDPTNFAYPLFARAAIQRRENVRRSGEQLKRKLKEAEEALADAVEELGLIEQLSEHRETFQNSQSAPLPHSHLRRAP